MRKEVDVCWEKSAAMGEVRFLVWSEASVRQGLLLLGACAKCGRGDQRHLDGWKTHHSAGVIKDCTAQMKRMCDIVQEEHS